MISLSFINFIYISVPIGSGKAQVAISRNVEGFLEMKAGEEGQIFGVFGKDLFLIETDKDKRRGFVSQRLFREMKLKRKGLVKSNVTAKQRPRLNQMKPEMKVESPVVLKENNVEEKAEGTSQTASNESEVPITKRTVEERTAAGQVVFTKDETPESQLELQESNITEEEDEDEEEDGMK